MSGGLFFFCFGGDRLQIFGFEDLLAVEAFEKVHTVAAGDDYRFFVLAGCLHTKWPEIRIILTRPNGVSRGLGVIIDCGYGTPGPELECYFRCHSLFRDPAGCVLPKQCARLCGKRGFIPRISCCRCSLCRARECGGRLGQCRGNRSFRSIRRWRSAARSRRWGSAELFCSDCRKRRTKRLRARMTTRGLCSGRFARWSARFKGCSLLQTFATANLRVL